MEFYRYRLSAADRKANINFKKLENTYRIFTTAARNCNSGLSFKRDGKQIVIDKITESAIELTLSSAVPLPSPNRTLSAYSRELIRMDKTTPLLSDMIYNHTLFSIQRLENIPVKKTSIEEISDSELLKSIIDMMFCSSAKIDADTRTRIIKEVKQIMLPFINNI